MAHRYSVRIAPSGLQQQRQRRARGGPGQLSSDSQVRRPASAQPSPAQPRPRPVHLSGLPAWPAVWVFNGSCFPLVFHMRQAALRRRGTDGVTNDEEEEEEEEEAEWKKGLIEQPKQ